MKKALLLLTSLLCTIFPGCRSSEETPPALQTTGEYHKISAGQAKDIMESTDGWILLDVRTREEYDEAHIDGAVLIPDFEIAARMESEIPDKEVVILVYCRSGRRSANAAHEILDLGYSHVYDFGGIIDWPYETTVEKENGK